ncbi:MAG TPA: TIGR04283 family arsenosugar biosynthesis glycosyltransferase [Burkholderiaceae bacterium]|jgi:rSAM/selenodomain-associated transferase 2|nr:TIGR04283 family arsenosugar biosynthesis glycosyltransferase [Burkholderiaceae bacterium]
MRLAVVVPVFNEVTSIASTLARLQPLRVRGAQVIVVDGGSTDASLAIAKPHADQLLTSPRGRSQQMNAGAKAAIAGGADVLMFLHADSELPDSADCLIDSALRTSGRAWGRFDVRIDGPPMLGIVSAMMNLRSRLTGIVTGDQGIFVTRTAFEQLGGFAPIALMEDIEFAKRAKQLSWPAAISTRIVTSGRRWQRHGIWRTIVLMWRFRAAYFFGADPQRLAQRYRDAR